jgi:prepilin signal peptidase PulO-like enzyme (type II secretory pathway)
MGLGDPKLALGIGWLLGFPLGVVAIFFSFILGSIVLVPIMLYERIVTHMRTGTTSLAGLTMKSEVPFGPFLIASCLIFWVLGLYGVQIPLYLFGF